MNNVKGVILIIIALSLFYLTMWSKYKGYKECIGKGFSVNFCVSR